MHLRYLISIATGSSCVASRDDTITRSINISVRFGTNVYSRMAKLGKKPTNLEAETFVSKV